MTIFFALNERFKASPQRQSISSFEDTVNSLLSATQKQPFIAREFEVKRTNIYCNLYYNVIVQLHIDSHVRIILNKFPSTFF